MADQRPRRKHGQEAQTVTNSTVAGTYAQTTARQPHAGGASPDPPARTVAAQRSAQPPVVGLCGASWNKQERCAALITIWRSRSTAVLRTPPVSVDGFLDKGKHVVEYRAALRRGGDEPQNLRVRAAVRRDQSIAVFAALRDLAHDAGQSRSAPCSRTQERGRIWSPGVNVHTAAIAFWLAGQNSLRTCSARAWSTRIR